MWEFARAVANRAAAWLAVVFPSTEPFEIAIQAIRNGDVFGAHLSHRGHMTWRAKVDRHTSTTQLLFRDIVGIGPRGGYTGLLSV